MEFYEGAQSSLALENDILERLSYNTTLEAAKRELKYFPNNNIYKITR